MARAQTRYVCQQCGIEHRKWAGRCEGCGAWNAIVEEVTTRRAGSGAGAVSPGRALALEGLKGRRAAPQRRLTGIGEFDRVLGGGLVPGSAVLVAGDPGIGKSTLMLQASAALGTDHGNSVPGAVYVSGEEATDQLRMRAERTGLGEASVALLAATSINDVIATLEGLKPAKRPALVVIDSIQTMYADELDSAPGTVAQVRAAAQALIGFAKRTGLTVIMVGHVTKEGQIAGPRVLEHMVDTVLYFEGERGQQFRILRAVKNRFGPTDEIGVFEMTGGGLGEVKNPSAMFLGLGADAPGAGTAPVPGAAVFAGIEGTRPVLVEIQALVAPSTLAAPRRAVVGWDTARLAMVIAVLDARCGLNLSAQDVYLSVAGGLRISEPAADLAVAAALVSSLSNTPAPGATLFFGEVGLSGEVRPVNGRDGRLREARKLGFHSAVVPPGRDGGPGRKSRDFKIVEVKALADLMALFGVERNRPRPPAGGNIRSLEREGNGRTGTI
ncbi:MAG: DNA repair protein RadA [Alphaproteobacteria bacterium]|nr:DNA repair protein RadA [Alphaproteobacteria bacterium]